MSVRVCPRVRARARVSLAGANLAVPALTVLTASHQSDKWERSKAVFFFLPVFSSSVLLNADY